ncbi:MAG: ATP-binding protein [Burkholderiaceae bacterium]
MSAGDAVARPRALRRQLLLLTLGTLLPVITFAVLGAVVLAQHERSTFERGARERTLAILTAIDTELKGSITSLNALASTRNLDGDDLSAFHDEAARVLATQSDWVSVKLAPPSGQQRVNVLRPFGSELPPVQEQASFEHVIRTGEPTVGDLITDGLTRQTDFAVRVPVKRDGALRYVLSAVVRPEAIFDILRAQQLPADWVGVVVDRNKRYVARTLDNAASLGQSSSRDLQAALAASPQGWADGRTTEGARVYTAHHISPFSGWAVAIGIPAHVVEAAAWQATVYMFAGAMGAIALAIFLAQWLSRRITDPIGALAETANALTRGETVVVPPAADIREVAELASALTEAGVAVHARVATQRQLETVTNNASVALFMTDADQLCTFMNPAAERMTGYTLEEMQGRPLHLATHGADSEHLAADCPLGRAFANSAPRQGQDVFVHRDRRLYDVAYATSPLRGPSGAVGSIIEARDITVEKSVEAERLLLLEREQRARSNAEAANKAKDEFLAMLGHELRNPLAAISNASHLLDHPASESTAPARAVIKRQSSHLTRLVDDLLDAGRVASGKIVLAQGPVELADVIRRTFTTLKASGRTARHHVTVDLEPAWVLGDETRLEQIVTNLLTNALRYTPAGGHIAITLKKDNGEVLFTVADSGIGIPTEMLQRVFDLFVQGDRGLERAHGGLGIGLTLVKRLVELHNGTVQAASDGADRGSVFMVRLPRINEPRTIEDPAAANGSHPDRRRILVVEDNDDARAMLRAILRLAGHEVIERDDGPSGLKAAVTLVPDAALVDVGLPGINGYEVARQIRATLPGQPMKLIALTGYGQPQDRTEALKAGFDDHLVKPVEPESLLRLLTSAT